MKPTIHLLIFIFAFHSTFSMGDPAVCIDDFNTDSKIVLASGVEKSLYFICDPGNPFAMLDSIYSHSYGVDSLHLINHTITIILYNDSNSVQLDTSTCINYQGVPSSTMSSSYDPLNTNAPAFFVSIQCNGDVNESCQIITNVTYHCDPVPDTSTPPAPTWLQRLLLFLVGCFVLAVIYFVIVQ